MIEGRDRDLDEGHTAVVCDDAAVVRSDFTVHFRSFGLLDLLLEHSSSEVEPRRVTAPG